MTIPGETMAQVMAPTIPCATRMFVYAPSTPSLVNDGVCVASCVAALCVDVPEVCALDVAPPVEVAVGDDDDDDEEATATATD